MMGGTLYRDGRAILKQLHYEEERTSPFMKNQPVTRNGTFYTLLS